MIAQSRADEQHRREAARAGASPSAANQDEEGYWAYMQRQINERTQNINLMGDNMENLERNSSGWAEDVNKFVSKQKRGFVMGGKFMQWFYVKGGSNLATAMKSKFGF